MKKHIISVWFTYLKSRWINLIQPFKKNIPVNEESRWVGSPPLDKKEIIKLVDRLSTRLGLASVQRYLPSKNNWPKRKIKSVESILQIPTIIWPTHRPRPAQLIVPPEKIEVTLANPDNLPATFTFNGKIYQVTKIHGSERIESEWWMEAEEQRDYFKAEDHEGKIYWIFKSVDHKTEKSGQWFIHGFFK